MVFNATFNNISVILGWSVLFVEEIEVHRENHSYGVSYRQLYHIKMYREHLTMSRFLTRNFNGDRH